MRLKSLLLLILLGLCFPRPAMADEKIWVGLFQAQNIPLELGARSADRELHERLHAVFGYSFYELLKGDEIDLNKPWGQWAVPRKDFFIKVEPLPTRPGQPRLVEYEIYSNNVFVAQGHYEPRRDTPLFIRGPYCRNGELIFVMETR